MDRTTIRWLVTGAGGQLGRSVVAAIEARSSASGCADVVAGYGHAELAVDDAAAVEAAVDESRPDVVVHCAAWTDVDGCERDENRAVRINSDGTRNLALACQRTGAGLVYVSTDFVFDGRATEPVPVDAEPAPLSAYGRSKLAGERAAMEILPKERCFIVRTAWVFGPGGKNFPAAILARARSGAPLQVVDDQVGSPTYTQDLAAAIIDLWVDRERDPDGCGGIYHAANDGVCDWRAFAIEILDQAGLRDVEVGRMSSAELDRPAPRPAYSVLDCSRLTALRGHALPSYKEAVGRYLQEESS